MRSTTEPGEGQRGPRVLIDVPLSFTGLALHSNEAENAVSIDRLAAALAPHADDHAGAMREYVTWFARFLADSDVRLYGRFAVSAGDDVPPATADLALAVVTLDSDDDSGPAAVRSHRAASAANLRTQYIERHPYADARVVRLGSGPALAALTIGDFALPPAATRSGERETLPQIKVEFQLPAPDGRHLAILAVTTRAESAMQTVLTEAMRIADRIRFDESDDGH